MYGVYLHVLADTLGSVGVIISSILIQLYEWHVADSASSALISLLILGSTLPLLRDTARQLLQGAPQELASSVNAALQEVQASVPGVERIVQWNIWHHAGDMRIATLHVEVANSADEQRVLQQTRMIFRRHAKLDKFLSVQISKPRVIATMGLEGLGSDHPTRMNGCSAGHSHSHNHGIEPPLEAHTLSSSQLEHLYKHPQQPMMSTHENPVSDDSCFVTSPALKPRHAHSHDHHHEPGHSLLVDSAARYFSPHSAAAATSTDQHYRSATLVVTDLS